MSQDTIEQTCISPEHITTDERLAGLGSSRYVKYKHLLDFVVALALTVLFLPIALAAMVLVSATSWGWPIYSQIRVGRNRKPFRIFKIRSMYNGCEKKSGPAWSSGDDDPRVTPVGRVLRATHIDELPQLANVLLFQMSLVGPRPERPSFTKQLEKTLPAYHDRHLVRPGITGLAQVQLPPDVEIEGVGRKLICDLYYIQTMSLGLDLRLALCTGLGAVRVGFERAGLWLRIPKLESIECVCGDPKVGLAPDQSDQPFQFSNDVDGDGDGQDPAHHSQPPIRLGGVQVQPI